jgi:thiamine biosynthesis lipoprotein
VEVGGEVAVFGLAPTGGEWSIGIQNPFAPGICGVLRLDDRAMATSGNYEQFFTVDGKRFSHIIDPRTGRQADLPAPVASATVVAPDCMSADGWATALSVLGEKGLELIEARPGVEAMLILGNETDYKIVQTSGFAALLADGKPVTMKPNAGG